MKKQYILFDFDGVIVNTEPQNAHYLQETLKSFGVYMDHEELKGFIGVNSREKILRYLSRSKENVSWEMYQKRRKEICGENQTARRELSYESFYICIEAKKSGRIKKVS